MNTFTICEKILSNYEVMNNLLKDYKGPVYDYETADTQDVYRQVKMKFQSILNGMTRAFHFDKDEVQIIVEPAIFSVTKAQLIWNGNVIIDISMRADQLKFPASAVNMDSDVIAIDEEGSELDYWLFYDKIREWLAIMSIHIREIIQASEREETACL